MGAAEGRHWGWSAAGLTALKVAGGNNPEEWGRSEQRGSWMSPLIMCSTREVDKARNCFCPLVPGQLLGTVLLWCRGV